MGEPHRLPGNESHASAVALALALALLGTVTLHGAGQTARAALVAPAADELAVSVTPTELTYGTTLSITGHVTTAGQAVPGASLTLQEEPYPFHRYLTVARATTAPDGSFSFVGVRPNRNTRLRVVVGGSPGATSQPFPVIVNPLASTRARSLGRGRTRLSLRVLHTRAFRSSPVSAWWYVALPRSLRFRLVAVTSTRELSGVTVASTTIDPPSKRFVYRVCIDPSWEHAMGAPSSHGRCREGASRTRALEYQNEGRGIPMPAYPSPGVIANATRFLDSRAGSTSFAVVNDRGQVSGVRIHEHFETASVVKVMMLVAYLQMLHAQHRGLSGTDTSLLYPMIHISDNEAASAVFSIVGSGALARVAREAHMTDYAPGVGWWAYTQTSAADQARFFFMLGQLIPPQFYAYARGLLSGIEPSQSWGIPPVARPRWQVFFKTGALPSQGLFNEVARLERPGVTCTIAVFTDGDPSMGYGEETIGGVGAALLARTP